MDDLTAMVDNVFAKNGGPMKQGPKTKTWLLIKPDGTETEVTSTFSLDEMYRILECDMVQMIHLADGRKMWMDEESKLKANPPDANRKATVLLHAAGGMPWDIILGSVLIEGKARKGG